MVIVEKFMANVFATLIDKFPSATIQYQHKELSDTHFFKVEPLSVFESDEFIDFSLNIYDEYHYSRLAGILCFITEDTITVLKNPSKTYLPKIELYQNEKAELTEENSENLDTFIQYQSEFRLMTNYSFQNISNPYFDMTINLPKAA